MSLVSTELKNKLEQLDSQWPGYVNMLKILESGFLSPKHWVLEFLQNAEDAQASRLFIQLKDDSLWVLNDGREFDSNDLRAICDVASQKRPSLDLHGYLGIGFKSVFRITNRVDVHSGELHFGFHREHWHEMLREKGKSIWEWPWEILPIEIEPKTLDDKYTTGFCADLTSSKSQEVLREISGFLNEDFPKEAILLLKHINHIEIRTPEKSFVITKKITESETYSIADGGMCKKQSIAVCTQSTITDENGDIHFLVLLRPVEVEREIREDEETERVRRSDIVEREIGLIIGMDNEGKLRALSGKIAGVYSFLPVEGEQTGLPFSIFGDLVPQPGRDLINYGAKWNHWMCDRIVEFFKYVMWEIVAPHPVWKFATAELAKEMKSSFPVGTGDKFWVAKLQEPIEKFLKTEAFYPDDDGQLRKLDELIDVTPDVLQIIEKETFKTLSGKKIIHDQIRGKVSVESVTPYELLHLQSVLEGIKDKPHKLAALYQEIDSFTSYYIDGRQKRDRPLRAVDFALGEDNQLHSPEELFVVDVDIQNIPKFLTTVLPALGEKHRLHPEIARQHEAVKGLRKCGLTVINSQELISGLRQFLGRITKADDCPKAWAYPDDLIRSALFLIASGNPLPDNLVAEDMALRECKYLFVPRATLDWALLYEADPLPMYKPIHNAYLKEQWLAECGISSATLYDQLKSAGVHGFEPKEDDFLTQNAAYAIALTKLNPHHNKKIFQVTHGKELGYDLECKGHCSEVFEVKGMTDPSDISLQPSEFEAARKLGDYYHLICVYNLPAPPEKVGYVDIRNPEPICRPVERAVIPKSAWLSI